jgi:hypothetical protein
MLISLYNFYAVKRNDVLCNVAAGGRENGRILLILQGKDRSWSGENANEVKGKVAES